MIVIPIIKKLNLISPQIESHAHLLIREVADDFLDLFYFLLAQIVELRVQTRLTPKTEEQVEIEIKRHTYKQDKSKNLMRKVDIFTSE